MGRFFVVAVFLYFFSFIFSGGRILSVYDGKKNRKEYLSMHTMSMQYLDNSKDFIS